MEENDKIIIRQRKKELPDCSLNFIIIEDLAHDEAQQKLSFWIEYYNYSRPHQDIGGLRLSGINVRSIRRD